MAKSARRKYKIGSYKCKDSMRRYRIDKNRFNNCKKYFKLNNNN